MAKVIFLASSTSSSWREAGRKLPEPERLHLTIIAIKANAIYTMWVNTIYHSLRVYDVYIDVQLDKHFLQLFITAQWG